MQVVITAVCFKCFKIGPNHFSRGQTTEGEMVIEWECQTCKELWLMPVTIGIIEQLNKKSIDDESK